MSGVSDFDEEIEAAKEALSAAHDLYDERILATGRAIVEFRLALARAWPNAKGRTADQRKDWVEAVCAELEAAKHDAEGLEKSALERIRSAREELGVARSKLVSVREELSTIGRGFAPGA